MSPDENLRGDEKFVIDAVAVVFSGTWRRGENPPDAYLNIGGREIAVEISTLTQHVTDDRGTRSRISDDKAAADLVRDLKLELGELVPRGQTIGLILNAPISKLRKTKAALAKIIRDNIADGQSFTTDTKVDINGNTITLFRSQHGEAHFDRISGIISNRHSNADLLCNARQILEDRIVVKAKTCARIADKNPMWLALYNDYFLTTGHEYRYALSLFSPKHPFEKIVLVNHDGTVELVFELGAEAK
jgi:hypothetical protein